MATPQHIAVIGAGLMGHGIALTMARAGHDVTVTDPMPAALEALHERVRESLGSVVNDTVETDAILSRISTATTVADCVAQADAVFEAAPEKLALKQSIFAEVEANAPDHAILASNTSVIQISKIMGGLSTRRRALGTHWWNPPHMIPLVEVVKTKWTEPGVAQAMFELLECAGKKPVMVEKTCQALSATDCNTRCGARQSAWLKTAFVLPRPWTTWSRAALVAVWRFLAR